MGKELTEAERAAANALARHHNMVHGDGIVRLAPDDFADDARAVVAAVAPIVKRETLDRFGDRMGSRPLPVLRTWEQMQADVGDNRYSVFNDNP